MALYRTLLVPFDDSPAASTGLDEAIRIASECGARLHIMNVVDDTAFRSNADGDETEAATDALRHVVTEGGERVLRHAKARASAAGVAADVVLVHSGGTPLQAIVAEQAEDSHADLIVLGTHGRRNLSRLFMSSDDQHLLNIVGVPVLLVRSKEVGPDLSVVELTASDSMFMPAP